jgi:hypothetical protein
MPEPLTTYIANADQKWELCYNAFDMAGYWLDKATYSSTWTNALGYVRVAALYLRGGAGDLADVIDSLRYWIQHSLIYIDDNLGGELTMLKIIDAMASSTSDELETFICMEDAFRATLWDKPFNYEWYAGMVRHFKSWL